MKYKMLLLKMLALSVALCSQSDAHADTWKNFFSNFFKGKECKLDPDKQAEQSKLNKELNKLKEAQVVLVEEKQELLKETNSTLAEEKQGVLKENEMKVYENSLINENSGVEKNDTVDTLKKQNEELIERIASSEKSIATLKAEKETLEKTFNGLQSGIKEINDRMHKRHLDKQKDLLDVLGLVSEKNEIEEIKKIKDEKANFNKVNAYFNRLKEKFFQKDGDYTAYSKSILAEGDKDKRDALIALQRLFFSGLGFLTESSYGDEERAAELSKLYKTNVTSSHIQSARARSNVPESFQEWVKTLMDKFPKKLVIDTHNDFIKSRELRNSESS